MLLMLIDGYGPFAVYQTSKISILKFLVLHQTMIRPASCAMRSILDTGMSGEGR